MSNKSRMADIGDLARRWHALAERRREHFDDLHSSGRWRKYYAEHRFFSQMRETARMTDAWHKVVQEAQPA